MKIIFLDIDGVVNCKTTAQRHRGFIGIDPYMSILVDRIKQATGAVVVLSSTWRLDLESRKEIMDQCTSFIGVTPSPWYDKENNHHSQRGEEIQKFLDNWGDERIEKYAIIDDDPSAMELHGENYFRTYWDEGLTQEIADKVIQHLNKEN